ncbi:hypothetical protein K438DRAFT_1991929 [Mycena galopus ATCC 62051]|nr:hypothetical protein K438DRAFT_1991929 [Mycena galopus ATCC 62051]
MCFLSFTCASSSPPRSHALSLAPAPKPLKAPGCPPLPSPAANCSFAAAKPPPAPRHCASETLRLPLYERLRLVVAGCAASRHTEACHLKFVPALWGDRLIRVDDEEQEEVGRVELQNALKLPDTDPQSSSPSSRST